MKAAEREQYQSKLESIRSDLLGEFHRLRTETPDTIHDESDLSHLPTHNADHDSEGLQTSIEIERVEGELLNQVDAAMRRIEEGTFGKCADCQKEIDKERLDALPYTPYCRHCAKTHA